MLSEHSKKKFPQSVRMLMANRIPASQITLLSHSTAHRSRPVLLRAGGPGKGFGTEPSQTGQTPQNVKVRGILSALPLVPGLYGYVDTIKSFRSYAAILNNFSTVSFLSSASVLIVVGQPDTITGFNCVMLGVKTLQI